MSNSRIIEQDDLVFVADLYHWRQEYPAPPPGEHRTWGFYLNGQVYNKKTKVRVNVKRISLIMGNHPNYFPGWDIAHDARMFSENTYAHTIGPWNVGVISETSVGGDAYFDLYPGQCSVPHNWKTSFEIFNSHYGTF